ncbi:MAG: glycoside hydrolase family 31 protein [Ferruginibacter sp.]
MIRLTTLTTCLLFFINAALFASGERYIKTRDGVIVYPKEEMSGNTQSVRIQVVSDKIIRVTASPQKEPVPVTGLVTVYDPSSAAVWNLVPGGEEDLTIKTKFLTVKADVNTGAVAFFDAAGKPILNEKKTGRKLDPVVYEGTRSYEISQTFETSADDAWYGLGQHQDGLLNYRGNQVLLFQNNTEVAVPFLISKKNYGILWDNYSITRAGDIRPYKPLSSLKLYSKNNEAGWLTATYCNNQHKPSEIFIQRPESDIQYEYLNDTKLYWPQGFNGANGSVTWEGSVASGMNGRHKLRLTYGGYLKVWVDGKLLLDRWRQSWNPGSAILDIDMQQGKKYPIKIEWLPDGGESYTSVKWINPVDKKDENSFGFCSEAGRQQDYYFVYGDNMDEVIAGYRTLTGKATMLPSWALGFWQSRERYKTQDEILNTVSEFRKRKIPLDNIVLDWSYWKEDAWGSQEFDKTRFSNADSMISVLHNKYNTHFMISVWPKFYEGIDNYAAFDKNGWLYKRNIADRQRDWIGKGYISTFYDPFNAGARKGFWELLNTNLYKKGVDAWWMDASEPDILSNVSPAKRKEQMAGLSAGLTAEYLNAYPLENAKGIYEGQRSSNPNQRVFILTRSAFAGMQRYAAATWSGDIAARWHDMQLQIAAGINFSMSGMPYWTMDAGGFAVEKHNEKPNAAQLEEWRELMTRWFQFGAFTPLFRSHGQFPYREIFNTAPEGHPAYNSMLYYNKLRYRLMPYIYSVAANTYHNDYTIMRGLVMDFPNDPAVTNINDQYLFGPSILVNPVYTLNERSKKLYLPAGTGWYDIYTGKYQAGGNTISADAPYERMPLFIKEGSIIPFGPELQYTGEKKADTITLCIYTGKDAAFTLYEDEGTNYNYEKGMYAKIGFNWSESDQTITLNEREGVFPGMLAKRYFRIKYCSKDRPLQIDAIHKDGTIIPYNGKKQTIHLK